MRQPIVVDVQNDFSDLAGCLYVSGGDHIPLSVTAEVTAAVNAGATVVSTQDGHPASRPHFQNDGGVWPVLCVAGGHLR